MNFILLLSVFLQISGLIIGLGAVVVIDIHGFLGKKSLYWTRATISTHKITKPLIWFGTLLYSFGLFISLISAEVQQITIIRGFLVILMLANGLFLSFYVSPYLLKMEKSKNVKILPSYMQKRITFSLLFSDLAWWLSVFLLSYELAL